MDIKNKLKNFKKLRFYKRKVEEYFLKFSEVIENFRSYFQYFSEYFLKFSKILHKSF